MQLQVEAGRGHGFILCNTDCLPFPPMVLTFMEDYTEPLGKIWTDVVSVF